MILISVTIANTISTRNTYSNATIKAPKWAYLSTTPKYMKITNT